MPKQTPLPADEDGVTVAALLETSRRAHQDYRQFAGNVDKEGYITQPYDETRCVEAVTKALDARREAGQRDPERQDPAWQLDKADHYELVAFYEKFLA